MERRGIPKSNLVNVYVTDQETFSRLDYVIKIAIPVRNYLKTVDPLSKNIRCLVLMYGLPLKIVAPKEDPTNRDSTIHHDKDASLDSEISLILVKDNYSTDGWIPNPYFLGFQNKKTDISKDNVLMVSRLDGPNGRIVKRLIDDSIYVEEFGLKGNSYFDARWPDPGNKKLTGYALYDRSIHLVASFIKKMDIMPVVLEDTQELFDVNECPEAALYCGWYSLAKYIDSFTWQPGSIGYHIASSECSTLKNKSSQVWCKMMLEKGISATIGPVGEPYVQAFPIPEIFFHYLLTGHLTLAECYMISLPYLSWKMVLIGDPLYSPFKNVRGKRNG